MSINSLVAPDSGRVTTLRRSGNRPRLIDKSYSHLDILFYGWNILLNIYLLNKITLYGYPGSFT
ncbi:hypothetical protein [Myxosarcina sp. GI1(2024)]